MRELCVTHMFVFSRLRVNFKFIDSKVCDLQLTHYDPMAGENVYAINEATNMINSSHQYTCIYLLPFATILNNT